MIVVIDFDDVLFDKSGKFTKACQKIGLDFGSEVYQKCKTNDIYDCQKHLKLIGKNKQDLEKILKKSRKFLLPNIIQKLTELKKNNKNPSLRSGTFLLRNKLILLSKGNFWFQKQKIKYSGIAKFFDEIFITDKSKLEIFKTKIMPKYGEEKIVFVDDKKEELEEVKKSYPEIQTQQIL